MRLYSGMTLDGRRIWSTTRTDVTPGQRDRLVKTRTFVDGLLTKGVKANEAWRRAVRSVSGAVVRTRLNAK